MQIERIKTGIIGLDEKLEGGFEKGSAIVVVGGPGSGKSIFGMQFLNQGLIDGEKCLYLSFEEGKDDIVKDMEILGMDPETYIEKGNFIILESSPLDFEYLTILDTLREKGISRFVLDSISTLSVYIEDPLKFRKLLLEMVTQLKRMNITSILIDEQAEERESGLKYFSGEYLADAVIVLYYTGLGGEFDRSMQIVKARRTNHERSLLPMKIGKGGIYVK
ncbi:MAG: ATPase domain-containing protein [Conexivisphaerales archaeon]